MNNDMTYEHIPAEQFAFVQENENLHDTALQTKARGFFADAMRRFGKNKSSVIAAWILLFLVLFSIFAPIISRYDVRNTDKLYVNYPAYVPAVAKLNLGIMNGARRFDSQNDVAMLKWKAIAQETGMDPVIRTVETHETEVKYRGQMVTRYTYDIEVNQYYATAMIYKNLSYDEYKALQDWQNETGIQVIYPYVDPADINGMKDGFFFCGPGATISRIVVKTGDDSGITDIIAGDRQEGPVNVYSITGQLIRANVDPANAAENLASGIYIINGKKMIVR